MRLFSRMSRHIIDYADKLADAMGEGVDSFNARRYARGSMRLRRFRAEDLDPAEPDEDDDRKPDEEN